MTASIIRYYIAQTTTSERIGKYNACEIAALLNAGKIQDDFVAAECDPNFHSFAQLKKGGGVSWVTISELLATAYKDKPLTTVILKDLECNTFLLTEKYHSDDGPFGVATGAIELYFDKHFKEHKKFPPKEFQVYFKSETCPPTVMTIKLKVENVTIKRGIIGSKYEPAEEIYPYTYEGDDNRKELPLEEFPSVALGHKQPKYDPSAPVPRW